MAEIKYPFADPIMKIERHEFASALALMKVRAMQLGLFKTMHAIDHGTKAVGWELAEKIEAEQGLAAKDRAFRKRWQAGAR